MIIKTENNKYSFINKKGSKITGKEKLKKDHKINEDYYKTKLRAIENINFMLINNDDAIVRTEKFIESILTKKR